MRISVTVLAMSLVVAASSASAITIDNFEEGPFSVSSPIGGETSETQGGLSTLNVISGQRTVVVHTNGNIATTGDLALTAGDDGVDLAGNPTLSVSGFSFEYAFGSPFDLTQGGSLDRFVVDTTAVSGIPFLFFGVQYGDDAGDVGCCVTYYSAATGIIGSPGAITVLFSDFFLAGAPRVGDPAALDLTQVNELFFFGYFSASGQVPGSLSVSNIAAVPEPSTALLLGCGLLAIATGRRRVRYRGNRQ